MFKRKISEFTVCGDERVTRSVPFALRELGNQTGGVELETTVRIERADLSSAHVYLRLPDMRAGFSLMVGGVTVATPSGEAGRYVYDVRSYLTEGENVIRLSFDSEAARVAVIAQEPELIRTNYAVIRSVKLTQRHDGGTVTVALSVDTVGNTEGVRTVATLVSGAGQLYYGGVSRGSGAIMVRDPLLWWPRGLGMQNMYKLTVNLYGEMEIEDTYECRVGLRSLSVSPDGSTVSVNGVSVIPMGATYTPDEDRTPARRAATLPAEISAAATAGFNTLVLRERYGLPERDLAELCDLHGILLVKEISRLSREGAGALAALSTHPSVGIFDIIGGTGAAAMLSEASPDFVYSEWDAPAEYPSAYAMASAAVIEKEIPEEARNLFSEEMESGRERELHTALLDAAELYPYASDAAEFSYISQLTQADIVGAALLRERMNRGKGGRAVFDGLGTERELLSRSALDKNGGCKALVYAARRAFSPVAVSVSNDGGVMSFTASNESRKVFDGRIKYRLADNGNNTVAEGEIPCLVDPAMAKTVGEVDLSEKISGRERELYLEYALYDGTTLAYRAVEMLVEAKRFKLLDPNIRVMISGSDKRFTLSVSATAFARGVELSFGDLPVHISDNFVDLTTPAPVKLTLTARRMETLDELRAALKVRSAYDVKKA